MGTQVIGSLTSTDTNFNLAKQSARLYVEAIEANPFMKIMKQYGLVNIEEKLTQGAGETVNMYNLLRVDSQGNTGDNDRYSNAAGGDYGHRSMSINLLSHSEKWARKKTMTQQIAPFDLKEGRGKLMALWMKQMILASIFNQAGGNTATSITIPSVSSSAFTGASTGLPKVLGYNAAAAPTSNYKGYGSRANISADESVTSSHPLKLSDFMDAREVITSSNAGLPQWNLIMEMGIQAVAFVSTTGMNQLKNDAVTQGQGINFAQTLYATLAGGKKFSIDQFEMENILFVEVPDFLMPRGVHSTLSTAVANTRRAVIMGVNAVDIALGAGYEAPNGDVYPGFAVQMDEQYKRLNKETYASVEAIWGCKKTRLFGQGSNASTAYDLATYVITHYSRT